VHGADGMNDDGNGTVSLDRIFGSRTEGHIRINYVAMQSKRNLGHEKSRYKSSYK
jgi:hypothetical protein